MNIILMLTVSLSIYQVESCQSGFFKSSIDNKSCCALCPAGSFMKKECDGSMQTECMACPVNTHTSSLNNQHSCDCPSDRYWHTILLRCMKCTNCEPGQKVIAPCEKERDSRCESCNKETYLHGNECVPCSYCKEGEIVMAECSASQNTVCKKVVWPPPTKSPPVKFSPQVKTAKVPATDTVSLEQEDVDTIAAGDNDSKGLSKTEIALLVVVIIFALWFAASVSCIIRLRVQGSAAPGKSGSKKSPITRQMPSSPVIKENNIMFRDVSADITERLGLLLNASAGKNWKNLAGLMGFTSTHTQNWELTPTEATQKLLQDWSQKSGSTVFRLYKYLTQMGRDDATNILLPLLVEKGLSLGF